MRPELQNSGERREDLVPEKTNPDKSSLCTDARQSSPEVIVGISRRDADGTITDVRTGARGVPAIMAHAHVWTVLIVVVGFVVTIIMVTRTQHQDPPRRDTRGCTERIERTGHLERIERNCELVDSVDR